MNTIFDFDPAIEADLRSSIEEKINQDIEEGGLKPCHGDLIRVSVGIVDNPVNFGGIEIKPQCTCGKTLARWHGSSDASAIRRFP